MMIGMPFKPGHRRHGGIRRGGHWRRTIEMRATVAEAKEAALVRLKLTDEEIATLQPLGVMLAYMHQAVAAGDKETALRCAGLAAPFVHPKLNASAIAVQHNPKLSDDELRQEIDVIRNRMARATAPVINATPQLQHAELQELSTEPAATETPVPSASLEPEIA
jgi:hypothetical protein